MADPQPRGNAEGEDEGGPQHVQISVVVEVPPAAAAEAPEPDPPVVPAQPVPAATRALPGPGRLRLASYPMLVAQWTAYQTDLDFLSWLDLLGCTEASLNLGRIQFGLNVLARIYDCYDLLRAELACFALVIAGICIMLSSEAGSIMLWLGIGLEGLGCVALLVRAFAIIARLTRRRNAIIGI